MPNAKDATEDSANHSFWIVGPPGSGKTTQFHTVAPLGRGFLYIFDPNCLASLAGADVEYEIFSPDLLDINVHPLSGKRNADKVVKADEPITYVKFEEHFMDFIEGKIDEYDWIGIDSFTTFQDAIMDRVLWLNERLGKQPEQADWSAQMTTVQNVCRVMASRQRLLICTGHDEIRDDKASGSVFFQPLVTGRLRTRLPLLFANIYRSEAGDDGKYYLVTRSDKKHPYIRSAIKGLESDVDVTVEDFKRASSYGLGKILKDAGLLPVKKTAPVSTPQKKRKAS